MKVVYSLIQKSYNSPSLSPISTYFSICLSMKLFLDTADLSLIKKYAELGIVDGITTNPTIIAREGADQEIRIREIAEIIP